MNHRHPHRLIIGPNGAGKTLHGRALAGLLNSPYADMSRVLKIASAFQPQLRDKIAHYVARGEYVPDEITMTQFDIYMSTHRRGDSLVFMGIPRKQEQVQPFIQSLERHVGYSSLDVADLHLTPEAALKRCQQRAEEDISKGIAPRKDDVDEKLIRRRLEIWDEERDSLVRRISQYAEIRRVDCRDDPQETFIGIVRVFGLAENFLIRPEGLHLCSAGAVGAGV